MNAIKAVEIAKKVSGDVSEDILYRACERLEMMIEKYAELKLCNRCKNIKLNDENKCENYSTDKNGKCQKYEFKFDKEAPLIAAGGVYNGYDDLYTIYLKREAALAVEDWDCFSSYDALYAIKWSDLCREIVRTHKPEAQSFGPDWRWG